MLLSFFPCPVGHPEHEHCSEKFQTRANLLVQLCIYDCDFLEKPRSGLEPEWSAAAAASNCVSGASRRSAMAMAMAVQCVVSNNYNSCSVSPHRRQWEDPTDQMTDWLTKFRDTFASGRREENGKSVMNKMMTISANIANKTLCSNCQKWLRDERSPS